MTDKTGSDGAKKGSSSGLTRTILAFVVLVVLSLSVVDIVFPGIIPLPLGLKWPLTFAVSLPFAAPSKSTEQVQSDITNLFDGFERFGPVRWNNFFYDLAPETTLYECGFLPWWLGGCPASKKTAADVNDALHDVMKAYKNRGASCKVFSSGKSWTSSAFWVKWGCTFATAEGKGQSLSTSSTFYFYIKDSDSTGSHIHAIMTPSLSSVAQTA